MSDVKPDRQTLLTITDYLKFKWQLRGKEGWQLHDLLMKFARAYNERSASAKVFLNQKDLLLLTEPNMLRDRFQTVWQLPDTISGRYLRLSLTEAFLADLPDNTVAAARFQARRKR